METKTKSRGWVKNAAIVFLAVMLVLTFFSNTIMNHSLPEAATQNVTSGTITAKVRGAGIVTANESYQVTVNQTRMVEAVLVKSGQEVSVGDVLFILGGKESSELSAAQDALRQLQLSYQQALISMADTDYSKENRDIQRAREALAEAQANLERLSPESANAPQESRDIERARAALDQAQEALLSLSTGSTDDPQQSRDIERASAALAKARETMDSLAVSDSDIQAAMRRVDRAQSSVSKNQAAVDQAQADLDSLGGYSAPDDATLDSLYEQMQAKQDALQDAANELESARLLHGADYDALVSEAAAWITESEEYQALSESAQAAYISSKLPVYLPAAAEKYRDQAGDDSRYYEAYEIITQCEKNAAAAQAEYDSLSRRYQSLLDQDNSYEYKKCSRALQEAKEDLAEAQETLKQREQTLSELQARQAEFLAAQTQVEARQIVLEDLLFASQQQQSADYQAAQEQVEACQTALEDLLYAAQQQQKADYQAAQEQVETCQTTLENLLFALQEQQKADGKAQQLDALSLQKISEQITQQQQVINELLAEEDETEVTAKVSGVIESVNVTAGKNAVAGESLAAIQVSDMGYSLSFSVTNEQARKVMVGDIAEVSNNRYGDQIDVVLRNVRADSQDLQRSKILEFDVTGDVTAGSALSVAIGQRGAEYDHLVPNSAIRSDTNGTYVFTVTTKSSPLGNRYIATRVDVAVLASDDANSAVTGALDRGDYVITTCSKPISNGDKVRMPG